MLYKRIHVTRVEIEGRNLCIFKERGKLICEVFFNILNSKIGQTLIKKIFDLEPKWKHFIGHTSIISIEVLAFEPTLQKKLIS